MSVFREYDQCQGVFRSIRSNELLEPNHPAQVIDKVMEMLDLGEVYADDAEEGSPPYHPQIMLKEVFYACHCGLMNFKLPLFAYWRSEDRVEKGDEYEEIRDNKLWWDITDFGSGDFAIDGLLMFTIRNGNFSLRQYISYAEKLLISDKERSPLCISIVARYKTCTNRTERMVTNNGNCF